MARIVRFVAECDYVPDENQVNLSSVLKSLGFQSITDDCVERRTGHLRYIEDFTGEGAVPVKIGFLEDQLARFFWFETVFDDSEVSLQEGMPELFDSVGMRFGPYSLTRINRIRGETDLNSAVDWTQQVRAPAIFEVVDDEFKKGPNSRVHNCLRGQLPYFFVANSESPILSEKLNLGLLPIGTLVIRLSDGWRRLQPSSLRGSISGLIRKIALEAWGFHDSRTPSLLKAELAERLILDAREGGWPPEVLQALENAFDREAAAEENSRAIQIRYDELCIQTEITAIETSIRLTNQARFIRSLLRPQLSSEDEIEDPLEYPIKQCRDVLEAAEALLRGITVTADPKHCVKLDRNPLAIEWATNAWHALIGIDMYVADKNRSEFEGSLLDWVNSERNSEGLLTARMVSYKESESTKSNPDLVRARTFEVPEVVSATHEVFMEAHLKIGQRDNFPRIHFYDDTRGATRRVIVGYFGEHLPLAGQ